jgi:hypothetical protein
VELLVRRPTALEFELRVACSMPTDASQMTFASNLAMQPRAMIFTAC